MREWIDWIDWEMEVQVSEDVREGIVILVTWNWISDYDSRCRGK